MWNDGVGAVGRVEGFVSNVVNDNLPLDHGYSGEFTPSEDRDTERKRYVKQLFSMPEHMSDVYK